jgi:hypothetical protein
MTPAAGIAATTAINPEVRRPASRAEWAFGGIAFHVESPSTSLVEAAAALFDRWSSATPIRHRHGWVAEPSGQAFILRDASTGAELSQARSERAAVAHVESHAMNAILETADTLPSLHACVVVRADGAAIACIGRCGSGKSTLALTLWHHHGWELACDDVALIDPEPGWVLPVPRRVSARETSRALLGDACWERIRTAAHAIPTAEGFLFHPAPAPRTLPRIRLSAIFLLQRLDGTAGPARTRRLSPADAALALAPYGSARTRGGFGAGIRAVAPLADAVPVHEFGRGEPAEMVRTIHSVIP